MEQQSLIPHLFRTEFSKITAVLCKLFGTENIDTAEDIAGETFLSALETWPYKGMPPNPTAWLYTVAKNKAKNYLQRNQLFEKKIAPQLKQNAIVNDVVEIDLSEQNINDSQLQMLFALCHPSISPESQIALALRILCGFGIEEIANAFLTNKETINKRLLRGKEKLRSENIQLQALKDHEINKRLDNVLRTIYLLFNEGYYSESQNAVIREDLCLEAMRLNFLLLQNEATNQPKANALLSLICFHSSRLAARKDENGEMILYADQDESLWNQELIAKGVYYMQQASKGKQISKYHLEAGIAYWHTKKEDSIEKWDAILQLFNRLLQIEYAPIAALNRTYALAKVKGKQAAITEAEKLNLVNNHYYFALLGELYTGINDQTAKQYFEKAYRMAITNTDKKSIENKLKSF